MSLINYNEQYALYKSKQAELTKLIEDTLRVASKLNTEKLCNALERLVGKVSNTSFKIQIAGTFKNGKSTFINALLGEEILPAYALPCTAVINEVKYGDEKKAKLYFKNPLPETLPAQMAERAAEHIRNYGAKNVPPMDIPYDEIEDYVIIPIGKDPKEMLIESPYEKVELFWPLDLLKNGIEIIDSPGLNEHATRTKVTVDYLSKADAILFVLSATSLCSKEEISFIENTLMPHGFNELFFIVNRFDLIPEKEKNTIKKYANKKLCNFTTLAPNWLFFLSALNALEAKTNDDNDSLLSSGFFEFEKCLSSFLTQNKGKTKLVQPARELKRIVNDELLKNHIAQEREILTCSLADLKSRYEKATPQLALLNDKRADLSEKIKLEIETSEAEFRSTILQGLVSLQNSIPEWVNTFSPTVKLGAVPTKEKVNLLISEILEYVTEQTEKHQSQWCKKMLVPLIESKSRDMFQTLSEKITNLLNDVTSVRSVISPDTADIAPMTWQSVVKIDELSDISSAYAKSDKLSQGLAKVISYNASASLALQVFESTNPITLSASLMSNVFSALTGVESASLKKIKSDIISELSKSLTMNAQGSANTTTNEILNRFKTVLSQVSDTLDEEISHVQGHLKSLISEMEHDDYDMAKKTNELNSCASELALICNSLDKFIVALDGDNVLDEYVELAKEIVNDDLADLSVKSELSEILKNIRTDNDKKIHISVIGEFSTGKSTFINALTKTDLMSSQFLQGTTVTATRIENSESLRLDLLYNNGTTDSYEPETTDELKFKLSQTEQIAKDLHSVKVSMPANTLGNDICIVDTPGINVENAWHEDVTIRAIDELCDVPLVLIDATKALPESLVRFIHSNLSDKLSDCLFVVTKLDMIKTSERSTVMKFVKAKLKQEFNIESPALLGYSAVDVLAKVSKTTPKNPELATVSQKNEKKIIAFARNHGTQAKTQADISLINKLVDLIVLNERAKLKTVKPIAEPKKSMFTVRQSLVTNSQPPTSKEPGFGFKKAKLNK